MNQTTFPYPQLHRIQQRALLLGGIGGVLCLVGVLLNHAQFFRSYLLAYLFWIGLTLGCLAILMIHHLAGGSWGTVIRRFLEAGMRLLPLLALLFVPLYFGLHDLYPWARPEEVAKDELLQHKSVYLNVSFFLLRTVIYFAAWIGVMSFLHWWSRKQEQNPALNWNRRFQLFSAIGLVLYGLTMTFAAIDWSMSLEPHWFSTIYGMMFIVGQLLSTLAFVIVVLCLLAKDTPFSDTLVPTHFHDLGNLLLAFVMLWAYMAFSQYLIIWSGNLPEEIPWYLHRMAGGWLWIGRLLIILHFALPFLLLLSRRVKRQARVLAVVALLILFLRLLDLFWLITPAFSPAGLSIHWLDVAAPMGIGGIWIAAFIWQLQKRSLLSLQDSQLPEVARHG